MKTSIRVGLVSAVLLFFGCSSSTQDELKGVLYAQTGTLIWAGTPAADGAGILFETADTTYGAPGTREDYSGYFPDDENQSLIKADIKLTGKTTVRGWGASFPEIEFISIEKADP